jgi:hypothetical protein
MKNVVHAIQKLAEHDPSFKDIGMVVVLFDTNGTLGVGTPTGIDPRPILQAALKKCSEQVPTETSHVERAS